MSRAKKCDRCGGFFDPFHMIGDMCLFRNPVFKSSRNVSEGTVGEYFIPGDPADYLDLCPDCANKFRLFMHGWDVSYKLEKDGDLEKALKNYFEEEE